MGSVAFDDGWSLRRDLSDHAVGQRRGSLLEQSSGSSWIRNTHLRGYELLLWRSN